jgi:hypothetical protein
MADELGKHKTECGGIRTVLVLAGQRSEVVFLAAADHPVLA